MPSKKVLAEPESGVDRAPDRVWIGIERKYRVAEYESLTVSLGASSSVDPGEDVRAAARRVFAQLRVEFYDVVEVMRSAEGL